MNELWDTVGVRAGERPRRAASWGGLVVLMVSIGAVIAGVGVILAARAQSLESVTGAPEAAVRPAIVERVAWPRDPETGKLRQIAKHAEDAEVLPVLFYMQRLPGGASPKGDIEPLGVEMVDSDEARRLAFENEWVLIDLREHRDVESEGMIPTAMHLEYRFEGASYERSNRFDETTAAELLEDAPGLVVYCGGPTCQRSYNACVALVQEWGIPAERVKWFRGGPPAWKGTLLVAQAREGDIEIEGR